MLQCVPQVFLGIEPFILNFPPQAATVSGLNHIFLGLGDIGNVCEALFGYDIARCAHNGFMALHPGEIPPVIFHLVQELVIHAWLREVLFALQTRLLHAVVFKRVTSCWKVFRFPSLRLMMNSQLFFSQMSNTVLLG